jgi:hypothetical protein
VVVHIAIDNDIELFWNGTPIGSFQHGGCASYGSFEVAVPAALLAAGDNVLAARASDRGGETFLDIEVTANLPPNCTTVSTDLTTLWPPNHSFRTVTVVGGVDPEGQPLDLSILSVTQDEPLDGAGDATTVPDADSDGLPAHQVRLRAERSGGGDGRVYRIGVSATDPGGSSCSTTITVGVPHDQRGQHGAVDTTAVVVDSFGPAPSLLASTSGGQSLPVADHRPSIEHDEDGTTPAQSTLIPEVAEAAVPVETQPTEPPATEPAPSGPSPAPVSPLPDVPTAPESDPDPPGPGKDHRGSTMRERRELPSSAANSSR